VDAMASEELFERGTLEGAAVVAFEYEGWSMEGKEVLEDQGGGFGGLVAHGQPGELHAGGEITHGDRGGVEAVDELVWLMMIDGPDASGPLPGELFDAQSMDASIEGAVIPLQVDDLAARQVREAASKGRQSEVRAFGFEQLEEFTSLFG
jgi:hypothetical protein